jgi:hypothetical protein
LNQCTPYRRERDQHATRFPRSIHAWSPTIHLTLSAYSNLSLVPMRLKQVPTPERSLDDQRQTGPAVVLGHLILSTSRQPWSRGERFRPSGHTATSTYWAHIPACDRYDQCLLTGANPSVLNRHRRGLQPWRCRLST